MKRRVISSFLLASCLALPISGSQSTYDGPALRDKYDGPILVDNSQLRYRGADMLSFDTVEYLRSEAPNLMPLCPAIDTWAAMHAIHPRVLIHVLRAYWPVVAPSGTRIEKETVHQIATGLALVYLQHPDDPLAASKAVMAIADAYHLADDLPAELARGRHLPTPTAPLVFGWFQPPWVIGDTWAGGGAHGDTGSGVRNALDYWGQWRDWGADLSQWWAAATGDLDITDDVEIIGAGAFGAIGSQTLINAASIDRVFHVHQDARADLHGLHIRRGDAQGGTIKSGGGIFNEGGKVYLWNSILFLNYAKDGGGIKGIGFGAITSVVSSYLGANSASRNGGGIDQQEGTLLAVRSTFAENVADDEGGRSI